jgi:hypothetical protein
MITANVSKKQEERRTLCCREKAVSITYSEYVSGALFCQHAKRMRRVIL